MIAEINWNGVKQGKLFLWSEVKPVTSIWCVPVSRNRNNVLIRSMARAQHHRPIGNIDTFWACEDSGWYPGSTLSMCQCVYWLCHEIHTISSSLYGIDENNLPIYFFTAASEPLRFLFNQHDRRHVYKSRHLSFRFLSQFNCQPRRVASLSTSIHWCVPALILPVMMFLPVSLTFPPCRRNFLAQQVALRNWLN